MRAVAQRVARASVVVDGEVRGEIGAGLLILLGVGRGDEESDAVYLADKLAGLRVFEDGEGRMNRSLVDAGGAALVISQFTLYGDVRRGRRPSFDDAAPPAEADRLYRRFVELLAARGIEVRTGVFQALMDVDLLNRGPVTILLDSRKTF